MSNVTFIIPNRGGTEIDRVINNFESTFSKYFEEINFIVIEQCDNKIFMKGQLYNIAVKYSDTDFIVLIDNDIYNLDSFNIIDLYNNFKQPYLGFDEITQITFNKNEEYKVLFSEKRLGGFGAFQVMKRSDFDKSNGFSNLCFGWGAEDDIFNFRIKFKRYTHKLGHINHPRRVNNHPESTLNNRRILDLHKKNKILAINDGYKQTIYDLIYKTQIKNILYLGVTNISVSSNYTYMDEYRNAIKIAKLKYNHGVSICITAYKAKEYIKETIDSIINQDWFVNNNNYEILIGIDGCYETLSYLKTILPLYNRYNIKILMMDSNKGTFITSNTLIKECKYDYIIRFDSDDIMHKNMVSKLVDYMDNHKNCDILRFNLHNFPEERIDKSHPKIQITYGQLLLKYSTIDKFGWYKPWICGADSEILERLKNIVHIDAINDVLMDRRICDNSLTVRDETNFKSKIRNMYKKEIANLNIKCENDAKINCITNTFKYIEFDKKKYYDGISICITAYEAQDFIKETLDSVSEQTWFKTNENWECIIGIDGCIKTKEYCLSIMNNYDSKHFKFLMMNSNKGTYVTTNTLMKLAKYNYLLRFDSDDLMPQNFIKQIMENKEDSDALRFRFKNFGEATYGGVAYGIIGITKNMFEKCGGYMPWICAADKEICTRLEILGKVKICQDICFNRRVHHGSLQYSDDTGMKSKLREQYHKYIDNESANNLIIDCVTNGFYQLHYDGSIIFNIEKNKDNENTELINEELDSEKKNYQPIQKEPWYLKYQQLRQDASNNQRESQNPYPNQATTQNQKLSKLELINSMTKKRLVEKRIKLRSRRHI